MVGERGLVAILSRAARLGFNSPYQLFDVAVGESIIFILFLILLPMLFS
jgi:hypothetical protein